MKRSKNLYDYSGMQLRLWPKLSDEKQALVDRLLDACEKPGWSNRERAEFHRYSVFAVAEMEWQ